jgi:hypothetical protein
MDRVVKKILFPQNVVLPTTYLNDVCFDLRRGSVKICGSDNNYVIISSLSGFALFIQSYRWD